VKNKKFYRTSKSIDVLHLNLAPDNSHYRDIPKHRGPERPRRYRGAYFRFYRKERCFLTNLWEAPLSELLPKSGQWDCKSRRRLDKVCYYILPGLVRILDWGPDKARLQNLVEAYFTLQYSVSIMKFQKPPPLRYFRTLKRLRLSLQTPIGVGRSVMMDDSPDQLTDS